MHYEQLSRRLASLRLNVSPLPAEELFQRNAPSVPGGLIASTFGLLTYYTSRRWLSTMQQSGILGRAAAGCWLAPTAHSACMLPYSLGLDSPREICLLVDVSLLPELWGPGTCPGSSIYPAIWQGGGIEFYSPGSNDIPFTAVRETLEISPCGE